LRILAIETSGSYASLAVVVVREPHHPEGTRREDTILLAERTYLARRTICSSLAGEIRGLLAVAGVVPQDLNAVACSQGPGSFTSLRVGVATANALAQALKVPLVGVPALQIVAASTSLPAGSSVLAASPSKRTEVFLQCWTNVPPWRPKGPMAPVDLADLGGHFDSGGLCFLAGEKARSWVLEAGLPESVALELPPSAFSLAKLARDVLLGVDPESLVPPPYLLPLYGRLAQPEERSPA